MTADDLAAHVHNILSARNNPMPRTCSRPQVNLRWYVRTDALRILDIDRDSYPDDPLGENGLQRTQRSHDTIVKVMELADGTPIAFALYVLHRHCIEIQRLAVAQEYRRLGVGRKLLRHLTDKVLRPGAERRLVVMDVNDGNLAGHLFLKACGWRAKVVGPETYRFTLERPR